MRYYNDSIECIDTRHNNVSVDRATDVRDMIDMLNY